ncbi:hypothetical protein JCM10908_004432 [Rhodotorula pacifica]|uniref:serine hydrolase domain-containing protein n=1 Tax=Rhodotorula pacifica TaxID=1495444 RepID=UPI003179C71F
MLGRCRPTLASPAVPAGRTRRAVSTAPAIDEAIKRATVDPYRMLPRAVVLAATSKQSCIYSGRGGYAQLPARPTLPNELAQLGEPITERSIFELYSCTKLVAAVAALQLVERGRIGLDDDASTYVPELGDAKLFKDFDADGELILEENATPITVRMLITHTAGFAYYTHDPVVTQLAHKLQIRPMPYGYAAEKSWLTRMPLLAKPGERFIYGTSNDWLTLVVEAVRGQPLEQCFQEAIFQPLGIDDISFKPNPRQISMAHANTTNPDRPHRFREADRMSETQHYGGAGLRGSPASFLKLLRALLRGGELDGKRILEAETVDSMYRNQMLPGTQQQSLEEYVKKNVAFTSGYGYGLGGALNGPRLASEGVGDELTWSGVANTFWSIDRERDLAFVVFTNILPFGFAPVQELYTTIREELREGLR